MLNLFPIQFLSLFAYFILRVAVGLIFLVLGYKHLKLRRELSLIFKLPFTPSLYSFSFFIALEFIISLLLLLGLYTQIGALLLIFLSLVMLFYKQKTSLGHLAIPSKLTYLLFLIIGVTLFITGAGVFSFDLPI